MRTIVTFAIIFLLCVGLVSAAAISPIAPIRIVPIVTTTTTSTTTTTTLKLVTANLPSITVPIITTTTSTTTTTLIQVDRIRAPVIPTDIIADIPSLTIIHLRCPETDSYEVDWPDLPYDFSEGDCAGIGKEAEIEQYTKEMIQIAQDCVDSVSANIADFDQDKQDIIDYLETMPERPEPPEPDPNVSDDSMMHAMEMVNIDMAPALPIFETCRRNPDIPDPYEPIPDGYAYTHLLETMIEAVNTTCERANVVNDDLICLCEDVADYVNNKTELYPENKGSIIHMFESYSPSHQGALHGSEVTLNWTKHLNETYHDLYNPNYVNCGPTIEAIPQTVVGNIRHATDASLFNETRGADVEPPGFFSRIFGGFFGGEEGPEDEEEPEPPEPEEMPGFFQRMISWFGFG